MKNYYLLFSLVALLFAGCTKNSTTSVSPLPVAAYSVTGISDIMITQNTGSAFPVNMPITLTYNDSTEQQVSVAISGIPAFIIYGTKVGDPYTFTMFTGPWSGIPTFTIPLQIYYNYTAPYSTGNYPVSVTCTSASGVTRVFTFHLFCQ
jgi:hypothetical protein